MKKYFAVVAMCIICLLYIENTVVFGKNEYSRAEYKSVDSIKEVLQSFKLCEGSLIELNGLTCYNEISTVEFSEPGWFFVLTYQKDFYGTVYSGSNKNLEVFLYRNPFLTNAVDKNSSINISTNEINITYGYLSDDNWNEVKIDYNGERYKSQLYAFYVNAGTYYLQNIIEKIPDDNKYISTNIFLPASRYAKLESVAYNADNTKATIKFSYPNEPVQVYFVNRCLNDQTETLSLYSFHGSSINYNGVLEYYKYNHYAEDTGEEAIRSKLKEGFTVDKNGEYSIYLKFRNEYSELPVYLSLFVDKIGTNSDVKSVKFEKSKVNIKKGDTKSLKIVFKPSDAIVDSKDIKWSSSNKKTATVDELGNVRAVKKGTCTITAKINGKIKAKCKITVK